MFLSRKKYAGGDPAFNVEVRSEGLVKLSIHSAMRWAKLRSGGRLGFGSRAVTPKNHASSAFTSATQPVKLT
jgi:hypothetical protein